MKQRFINRAKDRICRRLRTRHTMVRVIPAQGLFNFRCHENCVEWLRKHPEKDLGIAEVIYIEDNHPILHYVVHDPELDTYLEVTLGWKAPHLEYYLIRPVAQSDHPDILREFTRSRTDWVDEFLPWFGRKVLRIEDSEVL